MSGAHVPGMRTHASCGEPARRPPAGEPAGGRVHQDRARRAPRLVDVPPRPCPPDRTAPRRARRGHRRHGAPRPRPSPHRKPPGAGLPDVAAQPRLLDAARAVARGPAPAVRPRPRDVPVLRRARLQIQPLATFGHANALASSCLRRTVRFGCRPRALRRLLDRMLALGSVRGGLLGWEYLFDFGTGAPPWISAMTQATGAQALARGRRVLGEGRYGVAARRALGAFEQPPPTGVAVADGRGRRYAMYSFAPALRILHGDGRALRALCPRAAAGARQHAARRARPAPDRDRVLALEGRAGQRARVEPAGP